MRQFIATAVIAAIVFSAASPTFAQRSSRPAKSVKTAKKGVSTPVPEPLTTGSVTPGVNSFADFDRITAETGGVGVVISWSMRSETQVAFYQVYRIDPKAGRVAVGQPIVGSAGKTNYDVRWGESYSTYDSDGTTDSVYEIEATSFKGGAKLSSTQFAAKYQKGAALSFQAAQIDQAQRIDSSILQTTNPVTPRATTAAPDLAMQRIVAGQRGVKISVRKDGMYRVYRSELQAANFFTINGSNNSANWRLFMEGNEQAILVGAGDQYIEFYGRANDTTESDTRVYYLIVDTATPGLRMSTRSMRSFGGTAVQSTFSTVSETRERTIYLSKIFNGDASNYWGNLVTSGAGTRNIYLPNVDTTSQDNATITVRFQGYSNTSHEVKVTWNGQLLSPPYVTGAYQENYAASFSVPMSLLKDGLNTLVLQTTSGPDFSLFDSVKVTYAQKFKAYQNEANVFTAGRRKVNIDGFASPAVTKVVIPTVLLPGPLASRTTPNAQLAGAGQLRMTPTVIAGTQVNPVPSTPNLRVARLTVSRVAGSTGAVSADLSFADGTAVGGSQCGGNVDYVIPSSPTVTLPDGVIAKDVDITICSGTITDPNGETFSVTLTNPVGAPIATPNVRLFDLSFDAPQVVFGATPTSNGGNFGLIVPAYRAASLYAVDESAENQAASVTENIPSTLSTSPNSANMIIITNAAFMTVANQWADYRRSQTGGGFNVQVVDIDDLYDEYSYGSVAGNSIKSFLQHAYAGPTVPGYVMLIGDASYDPRNYEGRSVQTNMVPTKLVDLVFDEAPSDEALADFDGDGLAEIPIGRIPVIDAATAGVLLQRMQAQETPQMQAFSRGAVYVNDNPFGYNFLEINQSLRNEMPQDMPSVFVSRGNDPTNNTQDPNSLPTLLSTLSSMGPYIVNYSGHGASGVWGSSNWFTNGWVPQINNPNRGIYTMLTCLNGLFNKPFAFDSTSRTEIELNSLAETLLKNNSGGASVSWASTTETTADVQQIMAQRFYNQLNAGNMKRIGDLIKDAKTAIDRGTDVRYSWVLLGDPATKIRQ